ncbi:histidine kinase [Winogradskyella sp. R77965]|uniref:histidine kinase n=1 Tax=Winogradskyella sp. R77965 TaxID=3093872 RepID=UPI0037DD95FC
MNYKSLNKIITFYCLLFCFLFSAGQEQEGQKLIEHIQAYDTLETNEEKDAHLRQLLNLVYYIPKDSIDDVMNIYKDNFIARLAMADYLRSNNDHENAKKAYTTLEEDILKKQPVDYTLLAVICWKTSRNFPLNDFSLEQGLKELNRGLGYAEKSKVDKRIIDYHSNLEFYNSRSANYEQAVYHNKKHYDFAFKIGDTINMILALKKLLNDFNTTNNSESSIKIWNQIRPMFTKKYSEYRNPSNLLTLVTNAYININQLDSAAYYNAFCFRIDSLEGSKFKDSYNKLNKGKILLNLEKLDEAEAMFLESNTVAKEAKNNSVQAISSTYLSQIYLRLNQTTKAIDLLRSSYKLKSRIRNYHKGGIELWLSRAFEANKVYDSALFYRNESDKSFEAENRVIAKKQVALAKAELGISELLSENANLSSNKIELDERVIKTKKTNNILIYSFLTAIVLMGFFLYQRNQKQKLKISQHKEQITNTERIAIEAELNTIRSQMNPHFMFNSLNSINEFIQNDSGEDASNYLVKFSRLMRFTLNYSKRKFVTLEEEIDLLKLYIELENLRFYNSIDFSLTIDSSINSNKVLIPPMMIQPFVENAIWHGLMAKENNRKLSLSFSETEQNIICKIEDNGVGRAASAEQKAHKPKYKSQGIGLTQRRLELLKSIHGKEAGIKVVDLKENEKARGTLVKVILPKQIEV